MRWSSYLIAAERDTRDQSRESRTFVSYENLMNDWSTVRRRIEESIATPFPRDDTAAAADIQDFLAIGLRHHRAQPQYLLSSEEVSDDMRTLCRIFFAAADGEKIDRKAVDNIEAQLASVASLASPAIGELRERARGLIRNVHELNIAEARARGQVDSLAEQLDEERARPIREVSTALRAADEQNQYLAELGARVDKVENHYEGILAKADADNARNDTRFDNIEAERDALVTEVKAERNRADEREVELNAERGQVRDLRASLGIAETTLRELEQSRDAGQIQVQAHANELAQVMGEMATLRESISWRLTAPLRKTATWLRPRPRP
jgi:chromosome segregation ATPase